MVVTVKFRCGMRANLPKIFKPFFPIYEYRAGQARINACGDGASVEEASSVSEAGTIRDESFGAIDAGSP